MTFSDPTIEIDGELFLTPASQHYGRIPPDRIKEIFRNEARELSGVLTRLVSDLDKGATARRAFVRQSMRALQRSYYLIFSLGALSVDPFHVITPRDMDVIDSELLGERRFLQSFARDVSRGVFDLPFESRTQLYLRALRGVFELGRVSALPAGPYDWILGDTDHCTDCVTASLNGPYKRDSLSRIQLPVVPGIPGSGEVCQGLTRCGCTLRLRNFPSNEALQLELRDILIEVAR